MRRKMELVASIAALRLEDLELWISEEIVRPLEQQGEAVFEDKECARIQLVCTLHYDMEVETGTLPIILDLIDQLHETRYRLRALGNAVLVQDEPVRRRVLERVRTGQAD